ncbi:hypothetical protein RhiLY_04793 [Ceratobasidium sp. AG-Ba]|nr:hypothetical protein RhiLY_04793 [Ceratobasidium sp. AG-Ba]
MRRPYIALVPDLKSPRFDYLSHPGYMSPEESDGEGGLCTKRPDYRARWVCKSNYPPTVTNTEYMQTNNLPEFSLGAPRQFDAQSLGLSGTGSQKAIVRVAHCGISKTWRETYPDEFKRYTHLINGQDMIKPNIASFLEQHPEPCPDDNNGGYIKHESGELGGAPGLNPNAGNGQMGVFGSWNGLDYPGRRKWSSLGDERELARHLVSIEIDPEVLEDEARQQAAHTANGVTTSPAYVSEMPPPPPLDLTSDDPDDQVALQATHTNSNGKKGKKRAPPEAGEG